MSEQEYIKTRFTQELYHNLLGEAIKGTHESWSAMRKVILFCEIMRDYATNKLSKDDMLTQLERLSLPLLVMVEGIEEIEEYKEKHEQQTQPRAVS